MSKEETRRKEYGHGIPAARRQTEDDPAPEASREAAVPAPGAGAGQTEFLKTYIALDTETTGLNPKQDRIMEIGAIRVVDGMETAHFQTLVNPHRKLEEQEIRTSVIDMYCVKPLDKETIIKAAKNAKIVVTVEEHAPFGGLGSMVSQVVAKECPRKVINLALPDAPVIAGTSKEVFAYHGLDADGIVKAVKEALG